jgi:hemerythrin-like domain-containing protein
VRLKPPSAPLSIFHVQESAMYQHPTLKIIRDEHASLAAVLRSIALLIAELRRRDAPFDFAALRAMLFYIDAFPESEHHPKEHDFLFPKLRGRCPELADTLDRLDREHGMSQARVRDLEHQLLELEMMSGGDGSEARRVRFEEAMAAYIASYLDHMRCEEMVVLPEAERVLSAADWLDVDAAFMRNRDPLTLREPDDRFRPLFKKILLALPAPIGVGPALAS